MKTRSSRQISRTTVSSRYQTVVPVEIRERFMIREGTKIAWIVKGERIEVVPLPEDPSRDFRGAGRGKNYLELLADYRARERAISSPPDRTKRDDRK